MPEAVLAWIKTHNFNQCSHIQEDIILTYEDDFSKYKKRVSPDLLRTTLHGICHQPGEKSHSSRFPRTTEVHKSEKQSDF